MPDESLRENNMLRRSPQARQRTLISFGEVFKALSNAGSNDWYRHELMPIGSTPSNGDDSLVQRIFVAGLLPMA